MVDGEEVLWVHLLFRGEIKLEEDQPVLKDDYIDEFRARNLIATTIPILKFRYKNLEELASLLTAKDCQESDSLKIPIVQGLILTSPRVVEALRKAEEWICRTNLLNKSIFRKFNPNDVFVVGERTAQECRSKLELGCNNLSSQTGNSQSLVEYIKNFYNQQQSDIKVDLLYPKSSLADKLIENTLITEGRIKVNSIVVYETDVIDDLASISEDRIHRLKISGQPKKLILNMIFFSPSGVNSFLKMDQDLFLTKLRLRFQNCDIEAKYSSIGKTTEAALLRNNMNVFCVSEEPNPCSLVDCLVRKRCCQ